MLPNPSEAAPCPICDAPTRATFDVAGITLRRCRRCGHGFADVAVAEDYLAREYGDAYFNGGGVGYADYVAGAAILRHTGRFYGRLLRTTGGAPSQPSLLDVGAAAGFVAAGMRDEGWRPVCLEPNASMAAYGRERLSLDYVGATLDDVSADATYDAASLVQVAGHLATPHAAFARLARALAPGGTLLIETWNARSIVARSLGRRWHEYSPPSVLQYFTFASLDTLARAHGFVRIARGRPPKRIGVGHAASLVLAKLGATTLGTRVAGTLEGIFDGVSLPYPFDDIFYALYRRVGESDQRPETVISATRNDGEMTA